MTNLTLIDLQDKAHIENCLIRYATALDERNWVELENVFAPEAAANYAGIGEFQGLPAIVSVIRNFLECCGATQHLLGNIRITLEGDKAQARCYIQATHAGLDAYLGQTMTLWGEYSDCLERRAHGWCIVQRSLTVQHVVGDVGVQLKV